MNPTSVTYPTIMIPPGLKVWLDKLRRFDRAIRDLHAAEAEEQGFESGYAIADDVSVATAAYQMSRDAGVQNSGAMSMGPYSGPGLMSSHDGSRQQSQAMSVDE